jgi:predicted DNA binding CopG/RHH family protein
MSPEEILQFLEDFRLMHEKPASSRLISLKVPEPLLSAFRFKCSERGVKYQTRIKELMTAWVRGEDTDQKE